MRKAYIICICRIHTHRTYIQYMHTKHIYGREVLV